MYWLEDYVERLFLTDEMIDEDEFAAEHGIDIEELENIDTALLIDALSRRFRKDIARALPRLGKALLDKGVRGDIPAIRMLFSMGGKMENGKGKNDDPMDTFREL